MLVLVPLKNNNIFRNTGMLVLVPLTVDRFIAVVMPLRHRYLVTKSSSRKMSVAAWIPILITLVVDIISYNVTGDLEVGAAG